MCFGTTFAFVAGCWMHFFMKKCRMDLLLLRLGHVVCVSGVKATDITSSRCFSKADGRNRFSEMNFHGGFSCISKNMYHVRMNFRSMRNDCHHDS